MIPPLIVRSALESGINLIAITDHNSSANIQSVLKAASSTQLVVLPGIELQTREDVHSLCIFDTLDQVLSFQRIVDATLPPVKNNPEYFGEQFIVDETGDFLRNEEQLLMTSSSMSLNDAFSLVTELGGLFIPAHINRKTYGLIENLGFIPPDIPFTAVEISRHITPSQAVMEIPGISYISVIQNGDVHRLNEFLGSLFFTIDKPTIGEIQMALKKESGRSFEVRV